MTKTITAVSSRLILLLGCLSVLPGCLEEAFARQRRDHVLQQARFDSGCRSMRMIERLDDQRYKFRGCGSIFVYRCNDRPRLYPDSMTGALDLAALCDVIVAQRETPPAPGPARLPAPAPSPESPEEVDEPGLSLRAAPASQPTVGAVAPPALAAPVRSLPTAAELKQVLSALEPELRSCRAGGWVPVELRVAASGQLLSARVTGPVEASTRQCLEARLGRARLAPFSDGPISLAYLLDLRPAPAITSARAPR